ncbi:MAG: hypothetical protein ABH854_03945 [Candidatus Diapherotrites archaeon]|nr:hypothetical protein [Candidatus Micrarchaeota archaeon]MBU1939401.1 hypothetical protein [Candidatus Micrarchaeota archaeon]
MSITDERGAVFGFDLLVAFIAICLMMYLITSSIAVRAHAAVSAEHAFELQRTALAAADTLVKNSDINSPELGSAFFNSGAKRVMPCVLDRALLSLANPENINLGRGIYISELSLHYRNGTAETIYSAPKGMRCVTAERIVLVQGLTVEKAILRMGVCDAQ